MLLHYRPYLPADETFYYAHLCTFKKYSDTKLPLYRLKPVYFLCFSLRQEGHISALVGWSVSLSIGLLNSDQVYDPDPESGLG